MKIKEIRMDDKLTVNMGDYNSFQTNFGLTVEVRENDDVEDLKVRMQKEIEEFLNQKVAKLHERRIR
jgi:hypothetical protein